jgi:hypothetical protein
VVALEAKAGELGLAVPKKVFRRKIAPGSVSKVLDNRPRQLTIAGLPKTVTVQSVLRHFKYVLFFGHCCCSERLLHRVCTVFVFSFFLKTI